VTRVLRPFARILVAAWIVGIAAPTVLPHAIDLDHVVEAGGESAARLGHEAADGEHGHCLVCHFLRDLRAAQLVTGTPLPTTQLGAQLLQTTSTIPGSSERTSSPSRAPPTV